MLQGVGAKSVPAQSSSMAMARIACSSCHQKREVSATGTVLWKASTQMCSACHDQMALDAFRDHHESLRASLANIEASIARVRDALDAAALDAERSAAMAQRLEKLQDDLNFLRVGNGIHNIHYAGSLTRALVQQLAALCRELEIDEPNIALPEMTEHSE